MPQMKPMLSLNLYVYILLMFITMLALMHYLFVYKTSLSSHESIPSMKLNHMKWLW